MVKEITQWLQRWGKNSVALVVVTAVAWILVLDPAAQAVDEDDLQRLRTTNECPGCDLRDADLRRLDLSGANLEGANLKKANFFYAILDGANFSGADLRFANFSNVSAVPLVRDRRDNTGRRITIPAKFIGANLAGALLDYGNFSGAEMMEANFEEAYIFKTQFVDTQLQDSNFNITFFHDVDLTGANLCGSTYWGGNDYRRACKVPTVDLEE